jgi:hypothetical protein
MGESKRKKQLHIQPDRGPWLHGTKTKFDTWTVPPPKKFEDPLAVAHSAVFFTKHHAFAADVGHLICTSYLNPDALVLNPCVPSQASDELRMLLLKQMDVRECYWLRDEITWRHSWITGDVMRFASTNKRFNDTLLISAMTQLKRIAPNLSPAQLSDRAGHNITRGWIEEIIKAARTFGFDALQGHEIDRHTSAAPPLSRPWMAVFNSSCLTAPVWESM